MTRRRWRLVQLAAALAALIGLSVIVSQCAVETCWAAGGQIHQIGRTRICAPATPTSTGP